MWLIALEMKRVLKTRLTWILLSGMLLLSIFMAYLPVTFEFARVQGENGEIVELQGLDAIAFTKEVQKETAGIVTPEKLRIALENYQAAVKEYQVELTSDLPVPIYNAQILPYLPFFHGMREAFADPETGMAPSLLEIEPADMANFYSQCKQHLADLMHLEQRDYPATQQQAATMYEKVAQPYHFYPGGNTNVMDYQALLIFLLVIGCTVIAAPIFSMEYQTSADDILRCTKHGRFRLAITKIGAIFMIFTVTFLLCLSLHLLISNGLFGWEWTKTSIQMIYSSVNLLNLDIGQLQGLVMLGGLLTLLATASFTLFLSTRCKNTTTALAFSLLACILPVLVYAILPAPLGSWLRCILPAGGVGLQNCFLYALIDFEFLHCGSLSLWTPYLMLGAACIEIPLFLFAALRSYCKHSL